MAEARWTRVEELFVRALDAPDRAAFVRREAGDDTDLANEVMSLLDHAGHERASLLEPIGAEIVRLADTQTSGTGPRVQAPMPQRIGVYRIDDKLGEGGMGIVYAATREEFRQHVAIKVLRLGFDTDGAIARFRDERQILATLEHPNIVRLLDGGSTDDGLPYIVMERVRGVKITKHVAEPRERVRLVAEVCGAVQYAHERGVVHRDVKPSNILVDEAGTPKLLDFSIARPLGDREAHTRPGVRMFTPEYASPEQLRGSEVGVASDVYSLGAVLYELLAGSPPRAPLAKISRDLDAIVAKALHDDPEQRYASAQALGDDLRRYLAGTRVAPRRRWPIAVALAASVAGAGVWRLASSPAGDDCVSARARLAGVWDERTRAEITAHFASDADSEATWRVLAGEIDDTTAAWSASWEAACHAPDRTTEPLLYAQRQTCLDNVLIELHGQVAAYSAIDPSTANDALVWTGRVVADCVNASVLRAQVPAPPPDQRARVSQLLVDAYRGFADGFSAMNARDARRFDADTAQLDASAHELETIDPPAAAVPVLLRMRLVTQNSWDVASRLPTARAAIADARTRVTAARDDVMLANVEILAAMFELLWERDGDRIGRATTAVERAEEAVARAGEPLVLWTELRDARGYLAHARGDDAGAVAAFREARTRDPDRGGFPESTFAYAFMAARAGDATTGKAVMEQVVAKSVAKFGEGHWETVMTHELLAKILDFNGDTAGALAQQRHRADAKAETKHVPAWNKIAEVDLARRAGEANDRELLAAVHALAGLGTTPPHQNRDGLATVRRAGLWTTFERATELEGDTNEAIDDAAFLAFARRDDAELARRTAIVIDRCAHVSCDDWIRASRWLAILVDKRDVDSRLEALERVYAGDRQAVAWSGVVLASLGRWDDARVRLARARAMPNVWERQTDLVDVDVWLGVALLHAGDRAGARAQFEEALDTIIIPENALEGFTYMTPVAQLELAKLLPDADRARAKRLATRARDGFARLHRQADRDLAARWLDEHP